MNGTEPGGVVHDQHGQEGCVAMGHDRDRLEADFPGKAQRIGKLKSSNPHFARLLEKYDELNRDIHRLEIALDPEAEEEVEELKRRRVLVKDEIAALIDAGED
jgi:hypothetical protein